MPVMEAAEFQEARRRRGAAPAPEQDDWWVDVAIWGFVGLWLLALAEAVVGG